MWKHNQQSGMSYCSATEFILILFFTLLTVFPTADAQSYAFGVKGGPTFGIQRWNNYQTNDPLIRYHGLLFIETADEENNSSLFAEAGYHIKGRAIKFRAFVDPRSGNTRSARTFALEFHNISLQIGARNKFDVGNLKGYYGFALRGERVVQQELEIYRGLTEGVNDYVYGISVSGGFEFPFAELVSGIIDFRFSPDLSRQIFIPPFNFQNPYTGRQERFQEQSIKNIALEVSLGFRFLHKIIVR